MSERALVVPPSGVPRFASTAVHSIAGVVAAAHLAAAAGTDGYWFDEAHMLAIGRHHLDWGRSTSRRSPRCSRCWRTRSGGGDRSRCDRPPC